jgi:hypothetical protein
MSAASRASTATEKNTNIAILSDEDKICRSESSVSVDAADVLSFTFANADQYDQDKPVSQSLLLEKTYSFD